MKIKSKYIFSLLVLGIAALNMLDPLVSRAKSNTFDKFWQNVVSSQSATVPAKGSIEVAFSPDEGGEELILKTIDAARAEIRMLTYSFTAAPVVDALIRAKKRGVNVALVADSSNVTSKKGRAALSALVNARCDVRVISVYQIHHDKVIIVDRETVELGSYNYSADAAHRNSENVLVNWQNPELAQVYLRHFDRNQRQSEVYQINY